jgi:uroporphyrinogen-III synthase
LNYPCIDIQPPGDSSELDAAIRDAVAGKYEWIAFTSANAVVAVANRMDALGLASAELPRTCQLAAIGSATTLAIRTRLAREPNFVPDNPDDVSLGAGLPLTGHERVLLPRSALSDAKLVQLLTALGVSVTTVTAYDTVIGTGGIDLWDELQAGRVDAISLASASAVTNLIERIKRDAGVTTKAALAAVNAVIVACWGPHTAQAGERIGVRVTVVADDQTPTGLVRALEAYLSRPESK